jgi:two-component system chemotaxis response regulator CheB
MNTPRRPLKVKSVSRKIRVLVVDDSALARRAISEALGRDPEIEVVGAASDPYVARDEILALQPDVITLDLEMPRMDGLTFLKILQEHYPVPVVVVSSLTPSGSAKALEALQAGALDVLAKPDGSGNLGQLAHQLAYHVKAAAQSRRGYRRPKEAAEAGHPDWSLHGWRRGVALPAAAPAQWFAADRGGAAYPGEFFPHPGESPGRIVPIQG